ncbi:MAG: thiolase family protein [Desulfobacteraceae bacterium]|nr:thiolase family protein [Desulfobacteraceae bacterium]
MEEVYIIGAHTTPFGKHLDLSIKDLTAMTVKGVLADAGIGQEAVQAVWFSNSGWGDQQGQTCIRGQVALRPLGIDTIPITNVENACASGSTALHHAWMGVASGLYDIALAVGVEKLYSPNKTAIFAGFLGGIDIGNVIEIGRGLSVFSLDAEDRKIMEEFFKRYPPNGGGKRTKSRKSLKASAKEIRDQLVVAINLGEKLGYSTVRELSKLLGASDHSPFMDIYSYAARKHMRKYGSTVEHLAAIASKNHFNSTLNPNAQYRFEVPAAKVLSDRIVSFPLTRAMCAPIGDGAASVIVCSEKVVRRLGVSSRAVRIRASVLGSGKAYGENESVPDIGERLARQAYEKAGVGPAEMDLAEVHDATAFGELHQAENLGFCPRGEGGRFAASGATRLEGQIPINTSGGLTSRGHPIGASGLAQVHELTTQLRGEAGKRQVARARLAIGENGGGALGNEEAAMGMHILEAPGRKG